MIDHHEPPPVNAGEEVTPVLLDWLLTTSVSYGVLERTADLIVGRAEYGLAKYGQPLKTGDQRDVIHDALQELGDLMQYVMSARMQNKDLEPIRELLPILTALVEGK